MSRNFWRIAAPIAGGILGSIVPGPGTALGASLGAALASGITAGTQNASWEDSLKAAAVSGVTTGVASGAGSALGTSAGTPLAGGVGPTQGSGVLGAITRNAPSLASAGNSLSGMLGTSAGAPIEGGIGPTQGSGFLGSITRNLPEIGTIGRGLSDLGSSASNSLSSTLGTTAGSPILGGIGPTQGSGALGLITRNAPALSTAGQSLFSTGLGGGGVSGSPLTSILGGYMQSNGADRQKKEILDQINASRALYQPYQASGEAANAKLTDMLASGELGGGFSQEDFQVDPGYQFRQQQGQQALDKRLASSGNYFSGDALKAASQYNQGLASQEYQNAFNRDQSQEQQTYNMLYGQQGVGTNAASNLANLNDYEAAARAQQIAAKNNSLSQMLGGLF